MMADTIAITLSNGSPITAIATTAVSAGNTFSISNLLTLQIQHQPTGQHYDPTGANQLSSISGLQLAGGQYYDGAGYGEIYLTNAGTVSIANGGLAGGTFVATPSGHQYELQFNQTGGSGSQLFGVFTLTDVKNFGTAHPSNLNITTNFASITATVANALGILAVPPPQNGQVGLQFTGFVNLSAGNIVSFGASSSDTLRVNGLSNFAVVNATPEPSSMLLLSGGILCVVYRKIRRVQA